MIWKMLKGLLDEAIRKKVELFNKPDPDVIFTFANPKQIEKRFGGTKENITDFFPPKLSEDNIYFDNENPEDFLLSEKQYIQKFKDFPNLVKSPYIDFDAQGNADDEDLSDELD